MLLHFDGLNKNTYGKLHKEVHKAHNLNRIDALLKRINRRIFLVGKHDRENRQSSNVLAASRSQLIAVRSDMHADMRT